MPGKNNAKKTVKAKPLVTVITTVLNCVDYIEQAIQSVLGQTYNNIEYIIIDGASADGTLDIINRYKDYLSYSISEPDKGIYDGINKGIKFAKGDYIIVLNADDYFFIDAIENLVYKALETGADIVAGHAVYLNLDDTFYKRVRSRWSPETYLHAALRHEAMLASKESYKQIGLYDTVRKVISDRLWMIKAYEQALQVIICNEDIYYFRPTGISTIGENGQDVRHLESINYLSNMDPSLTEEDYSKIARPAKLTIEEINYYIGCCCSDKLRVALTSLRRRRIISKRLRVREKIVKQIMLAWKELLSSKQWKAGCLLTFIVPVSNKEKEAINKISDLVTDYENSKIFHNNKDEIAYLDDWLARFNLSFEVFIKTSLRWKTGKYIVSFIKSFVDADISLSPDDSIMACLVKANMKKQDAIGPFLQLKC